jgi:hypothetical protein
MKLKNQRRDNNVDLTRSTMQQKVNSLHKRISLQNQAAERKNRKINQLRGFIGRLIGTKVIQKEEFKKYIDYGKSHA